MLKASEGEVLSLRITDTVWGLYISGNTASKGLARCICSLLVTLDTGVLLSMQILWGRGYYLDRVLLFAEGKRRKNPGATME
ncbi:hypothetical protein FKM82_003392 [Ascaphus truei]